MAGKPVEWRRFEPLELQEKVPVFVPSASDAPSQSAAPPQDFVSLLRAFERALRENERLRKECAELRSMAKSAKEKTAKVGGNGGGEFRAEERLRRAQANIRELREKALGIQSEISGRAPAARAEIEVEAPVPQGEEEPAGDLPPSCADARLRRIAQAAAAWVFAAPTEQNVRLVEDALRGRGIDALLNGGPSGISAE